MGRIRKHMPLRADDIRREIEDEVRREIEESLFPSTEDPPPDYGENFERDKFLFCQRPKTTLKKLEAMLKKFAPKKRWQIISQRQIRDAIKTYAAHIGKPVPKGPVGRPRKSDG